MAVKLRKLEDLFFNVMFVGNSIKLIAIKSNYANNAVITLCLKLPIRWIQKVKWYSIEKKVGNQIRKLNNGNKENLNNSKRKRNINMTEERNKHLFLMHDFWIAYIYLFIFLHMLRLIMSLLINILKKV
jgi:hypothetical protein